jgi:hypothetical protein
MSASQLESSWEVGATAASVKPNSASASVREGYVQEVEEGRLVKAATQQAFRCAEAAHNPR